MSESSLVLISKQLELTLEDFAAAFREKFGFHCQLMPESQNNMEPSPKIVKIGIFGEPGHRHFMAQIAYGEPHKTEVETIVGEISQSAYMNDFEINELRQKLPNHPVPFLFWLFIYE